MQNNHISSARGNLTAWVVCMTGALYFFYIYLQMMMFNAIGHEIMVDFSLSSTGLGGLSSAYFWGNVVFLFPAGLLLDRFSTKKLLLIVMTVSILSTLLFSFTTTLEPAIICRLFLGIAGAFALLVGLRLASRWFPPSQMALASGFIITIGFLGGLVSQTPLTILVNHVGWRHALQWDAALGLVFIIVMFVAIKDYPKGYQRSITNQQIMSLRFLWLSIKKSVTHAQNWLCGLYTCFLNLPIFIFGGAFGIRYLDQMHHLSETNASIVMSALLLGAMLGSPVFGWISDRMGLRKIPMIIGALLSILNIFIIMYMPGLTFGGLLTLFFTLGFITSAQVISYPMIAESNPETIVGTALGIGSTLIMSGGAIFLPMFGWFLDLNWNGQMLNGVPWHSLSDYHLALMTLPIALVVALLAVLMTKETYCGKRKVFKEIEEILPSSKTAETLIQKSPEHKKKIPEKIES